MWSQSKTSYLHDIIESHNLPIIECGLYSAISRINGLCSFEGLHRG